MPAAARQSPSSSNSSAAIELFEDALAQALRWLEDRDTLGELARRSGHALPVASWALLEHLHARGPLRVSDVAACHGVHPSSVIPRLNALAGTGLIERGNDPADARASVISITPAGSAALRAMHKARQDALARAVEDVEPAKLGVATEVLASIADRLTVDRLIPRPPAGT